MNTLTANELKTGGISILEDCLKHGDEVVISVRGQQRYVVMDIEKYNQLRELELATAAKEVKTDYAAGRYNTESAAEHIQRINVDE